MKRAETRNSTAKDAARYRHSCSTLVRRVRDEELMMIGQIHCLAHETRMLTTPEYRFRAVLRLQVKIKRSHTHTSTQPHCVCVLPPLLGAVLKLRVKTKNATYTYIHFFFYFVSPPFPLWGEQLPPYTHTHIHTHHTHTHTHTVDKSSTMI